MTYEAWENYATWNVALWINNEYALQQKAINFMRIHQLAPNPYMSFVQHANLSNAKTLDDIAYTSKELNTDELDDMMQRFLEIN